MRKLEIYLQNPFPKMISNFLETQKHIELNMNQCYSIISNTHIYECVIALQTCSFTENRYIRKFGKHKNIFGKKIRLRFTFK